MNTPIYNKLKELDSEKRIPFHMPGHKRIDFGAFFGIEKMDITEITDYDNLHEPEGIIRESMDLVKDIFKSTESWYLVGGSTLGILVSISSVCKPGDKILIGRNCHKAVYNCIRLLQLEAVYCYADISQKYDVCVDMKPEMVEKKLKENPEIKAVVLTSPTYEGVVSDIKGIKKTIQPYEIPLIVDEAHGAHFHFSNYFPASAAELGADLVIQSFHKTLPAMTQTAVLHNCSDRVDSRLIRRFMGIYQTSSPSYILMASIDACMDTMAAEGKQMFRDFTRILEQTRKRLSVCKYIRLVDPVKGKNGVFDYDRSKLVFSTRASLLSGSDLYHILLDRYHIQMEMESENYVLAIASVGDREEGFERLCQAIEELDQEQADLIKAGIPAEENKKLDTRSMHFVLTQMMSMADAMEAPTEKCPLEESIGRISAEFAYLYPPGIPLITPGEQITGQFIRNMRIYMDKGLYLQGLEDYTNKTILVVEQQPQSTKEQDEEIHG